MDFSHIAPLEYVNKEHFDSLRDAEREYAEHITILAHFD